MIFIDKLKIQIEAGDGGNGCLSFRREKFIPRGGPDGGDGGRGADVYLQASRHVNTFHELSFNPHLRAESGDHGKGQKMTGYSGNDFVQPVPPGTMIWQLDGDQKVFLGELLGDGEKLRVAKGGKGGRGNVNFKTSTNRAPRMFEEGQPGEDKTLELELKLLADVGLVGFPNAGKSTLLSRITRAKPKIANYPFTTLNPILGVCGWKGKSFVVADIPGLIEGAHQGKGLGDEFLRHVERTRVLIHVIDPGGFGAVGASASIRVIEQELKRWNEQLLEKPRLIVVNKMDLGDEAKKHLAKLKRSRRKTQFYPISAVTGEGLDQLLDALMAYL